MTKQTIEARWGNFNYTKKNATQTHTDTYTFQTLTKEQPGLGELGLGRHTKSGFSLHVIEHFLIFDQLRVGCAVARGYPSG